MCCFWLSKYILRIKVKQTGTDSHWSPSYFCFHKRVLKGFSFFVRDDTRGFIKIFLGKGWLWIRLQCFGNTTRLHGYISNVSLEIVKRALTTWLYSHGVVRFECGLNWILLIHQSIWGGVSWENCLTTSIAQGPAVRLYRKFWFKLICIRMLGCKELSMIGKYVKIFCG